MEKMELEKEFRLTFVLHTVIGHNPYDSLKEQGLM